MTKLNQILAVEKGVKSRAFSELSAAHQAVQKPPLLAGLSRRYKPKDDDGDVFPGESTLVQLTASEVIGHVAAVLTRLFDVTAAKDWTNCAAQADLVVDGQVLLAGVPVTYLLFLEKQLNDQLTFISKLPILDPAESWTYDAASGHYRSSEAETGKTKKIPKTLVKYPATDKHPAQVEVYYEDDTIGHWTTVKFSGALPADRVKELTARVLRLIEAVKVAREEANSTIAVDKSVGGVVFGYLFG